MALKLRIDILEQENEIFGVWNTEFSLNRLHRNQQEIIGLEECITEWLAYQREQDTLEKWWSDMSTGNHSSYLDQDGSWIK